MNNRSMQITSAPVPWPAQTLPAFGLGGLPSFARALRQRGLISHAQVANDLPVAQAEPAESWIRVQSVYEAHLQRRAMEQAFAAMRGDLA